MHIAGTFCDGRKRLFLANQRTVTAIVERSPSCLFIPDLPESHIVAKSTRPFGEVKTEILEQIALAKRQRLFLATREDLVDDKVSLWAL
jgi:hypothetical protein